MTTPIPAESAIERDREIALAARIAAAGSVNAAIREHEHRLWSRQPLYDALVDAVREYKRTQFEGAHQERLRAVDAMTEALAALDREERP